MANPILGRLVTCQNVTMAQFAELLPGIAPGYIHNEVLDKTGLEGGWDFTLSSSGAGFQAGGGGGRGETVRQDRRLGPPRKHPTPVAAFHCWTLYRSRWDSSWKCKSARSPYL